MTLFWAASAAVACGALFWLCFVLPTLWMKKEKAGKSLGAGAKIIQISDMHVERIRISPKKIRKEIEKEKPDFLFFTGDFADKPGSMEKLDTYFAEIQKTGVPAFAVLGNHDYMLERPEELESVLKNRGVDVLKNENRDMGAFVLVGIDDYCSGKSDEEKAFAGLSGEKPSVVITHDPNIVLAMKTDFDYLMSGHLHGKQFNVPFFFRFVNMGALPKKGVYQGTHAGARGTFYISKGVGQSGVNLRFLIRSEITVHEI